MARRTARASSEFQPQLALLVRTPPTGPEWVHELKLDGYRIGALIQRGRARLLSRNGLDWTDRLPEIREAVERLSAREAVLDGEVAIADAQGRTNFQALQNAFAGTAARRGLRYFVFDVLRLEGEDLAREPLLARKERVRRLLKGVRAPIQYCDHVEGDGGRVLDEACRLGLEGIVSKRADAPYEPGRRGTWVKTKCVRRQELVVGGYTDPEGARQGIGALLVGHRENGRLVFAGKVGTGFTQESARALRARLERLEIGRPPFDPRPPGWLGRNAHWVEPRLVAEVAFTEWTEDGRVRHPSFQGLREDKDPREVVREAPVRAGAARPTAGRARARSAAVTGSRKTRTTSTAERPADVLRPDVPSARSAPHRSTSAGRAAATQVAGVRLTHPDRVLYPESGLTKADLAAYYEQVADRMLPHVRARPLTLVRCPTGRDAGCFYMKHSKVGAPPAMRRVLIPEKTKTGEYLVADTLPALLSLVQMNVLEIHTWNSIVGRLEEPDRIVLDVDPGPEVTWNAVIAAARTVRELLRIVGLESFVKTTGGRGLHVVAPLDPAAGWEDCLAFARALASAMERSDPQRYTTTFKKAGRERKILIDYLRNNRTNTSIAAFSTRARPNATVSLPVRWEDLGPSVDPASFTATTVPARVRRSRRDPWADYGSTHQRLPKDGVRLLERQ